MTITIIEQIKPIDGAAARRLAHAAGAIPGPNYDDLADGIEEFIEAVEKLHAPGAPDIDYDLDATRITVGGATVWSCRYNDGMGDGSAWTANARWFEDKVPGLMTALGVRLDVSAGAYGTPAHTVP